VAAGLVLGPPEGLPVTTWDLAVCSVQRTVGAIASFGVALGGGGPVGVAWEFGRGGQSIRRRFPRCHYLPGL
jgi:hypothetical protein